MFPLFSGTASAFTIAVSHRGLEVIVCGMSKVLLIVVCEQDVTLEAY